ncbi:MAG: outer membrane protein assembly factor BamE [Psychrobacter glaciei]|jgi:outer membrane protein assembly factor BamE
MFRFIITATLITLLSACSMQVYKLNIQQGNIVTQDMLDQLKPGMSKTQVAYIMGNPVLNDTFAMRQWDYIYRTERREDEVNKYHIRINFDQMAKYTHFEGSLPGSTAPVLQTKEDQPVKAFEKN